MNLRVDVRVWFGRVYVGGILCSFRKLHFDYWNSVADHNSVVWRGLVAGQSISVISFPLSETGEKDTEKKCEGGFWRQCWFIDVDFGAPFRVEGASWIFRWGERPPIL